MKNIASFSFFVFCFMVKASALSAMLPADQENTQPHALETPLETLLPLAMQYKEISCDPGEWLHLKPLSANLYEPILNDVKEAMDASSNPLDQALSTKISAKIGQEKLCGLDIIEAHLKLLAHQTAAWTEGDKTLFAFLNTMPYFNNDFDIDTNTAPICFAEKLLGLFSAGTIKTKINKAFDHTFPLVLLPVRDTRHLFPIKTLTNAFLNRIYPISFATDVSQTYDIHGISVSALGYAMYDLAHAFTAIYLEETAFIQAQIIPAMHSFDAYDTYNAELAPILFKRADILQKTFASVAHETQSNDVLQAALFYIFHEASVPFSLSNTPQDLEVVWRSLVDAAHLYIDEQAKGAEQIAKFEKYATHSGENLEASLAAEAARKMPDLLAQLLSTRAQQSDATILVGKAMPDMFYSLYPTKDIKIWENKRSQDGMLLHLRVRLDEARHALSLRCETVSTLKAICKEKASLQGLIDMTFGQNSPYKTTFSEGCSPKIAMRFLREKNTALKSMLDLSCNALERFLETEGSTIQDEFAQQISITDEHLRNLMPPYTFGQKQHAAVENSTEAVAAETPVATTNPTTSTEPTARQTTEDPSSSSSDSDSHTSDPESPDEITFYL